MTAPLSEFFSTNSIKGFLDHAEGLALYELALTVANIGSCLEIGSYCGKSSVYIGQACRETGNTLYAVDHHRGSEEHQPGEEYHDKDLYDVRNQHVDSLPQFRRTLALAELENVVVPLVSSSQTVVKSWQAPLGLVFVDGGHSPESSMHDCIEWSKRIAEGGYLAIHDIFEKPEDGGQGPWLAMCAVLQDSRWQLVEKIESLGILRFSQ